MADSQPIHDAVRDYYSRVLSSSADLKTSACCTADAMPGYLRALLANVHDEVKDRYYGCGTPVPSALAGATVLDLGCGTGRDVYMLAQLVGPEGFVIGVDMTEEQLEVARRHQAWHSERLGYDNVHFVQGTIEDLAAAGIKDATVDLIVSNCVVNLSPDKPKVLAEAFRALKPGGELYFSDVFADRRVPEHLATDPVLLGECLGGALYGEDFRRIMADIGCADVRTVSSTPIELHDEAIHHKIGHIGFSSRTIRAFKLDLEDRCEDYGQVATYKGTISEAPHAFVLDDHHRLEAGRPMLVCGNTADMLAKTRYAPHFAITGDKSVHFGLFDCAGPAPAADNSGAACC